MSLVIELKVLQCLKVLPNQTKTKTYGKDELERLHWRLNGKESRIVFSSEPSEW